VAEVQAAARGLPAVQWCMTEHLLAGAASSMGNLVSTARTVARQALSAQQRVPRPGCKPPMLPCTRGCAPACALSVGAGR
jgi:hypothetical protein